MCGIVGYIGQKNCVPILIDGLKRLEYRGYDSAGIGILQNDVCLVEKYAGKVSVLSDSISKMELFSNIGLGHTRWATHGVPNKINAHPHFNSDNSIMIIHNGIIENYTALKSQLESEGYAFRSDTDTEVLINLIDKYFKTGKTLFESVRTALNRVHGAYGIGVIAQDEPNKIIVAKKGSPLVIGIGNNENFIASDVNALIPYTNNVVYMEDDEIAEITADNFSVRSISNEKLEKNIETVDMNSDEITKNGYAHFMLKEIVEQPASIKNSLRGRLIEEEGLAKLGGLIGFENRLAWSDRIIISACGTSWHAALVGEYMIEQYTGIPVEVEYASEFRYRDPIINKNDTVIFISQSGETADTLAALKEAKRREPLILGVCNVIGSSIARASDAGVYIHAGPEIGVASTKAFTSQLTVMALITLLIARKKRMSMLKGREVVSELLRIPDKVNKILELSDQIAEIAEHYADAKNFLYLGRGYNFPVALEGALKLKEISYIHAEGYPAAEMKHGPIALIDENMPVVFIATHDAIYDKVLSNIEEVRARNGKVIVICNEKDDKLESLSDYSIIIPKTINLLTPILTSIPLQLLAYHIAVKKGLNVDQPRNLAKSVTVE